MKRPAVSTENSPKKPKLALNPKKPKSDNKKGKLETKPTIEKSTPTKLGKKSKPNAPGKFNKNGFQSQEKIEDWNEFKKKKKELKIKRKQERSGTEFDIITKAKKFGEKLRQKTLKGGEEERNKLINELHGMLKGKGHYAKFVLAHDTARIVQWLLKYSSNIVVQQISKELIPVTVPMLQSKYGIFCVKRLLKYGSQETRSGVIDSILGNSVKLTSHAVSAPVVEYAFSTWATPIQKQYLIQEFYGDLYKNSKDSNVKHIRDIYKDDDSLKVATLGATKANLMRILNKNLLDSGLVQTVIHQFLSECTLEDRAELISQLSPHIVVISNSKDGARSAMQCIWHGSNKDRKVIIKALKEHIVELCKHEHGHCTIISLLDSVDDTVLLHKVILSEILKSARDLAVTEWGRKVLLWLVAPADSTLFHPVFINELKAGRELSTCKKLPEIRQKEIVGYSISTLLSLVANEPEFWLSTSSLAIEMLAILKAGSGEELGIAYKSLVKIITKSDWKIKEGENEILGVEQAGVHMALKKLAQHDKINVENGKLTFGSELVEQLSKEVITLWIGLNRGCFLLVTVFENSTKETQDALKMKLEEHVKLLKNQNTKGAKILLKKLK